MAIERTANCSCGALQAVCAGEPLRLSVCHCLACKQRTGSTFSYNATFACEQVTVTGPESCFTRRSDEGRWCRFRFCPTCGATVVYELEIRPGRISVPVGAFADPAFPAPTIEVYAERREAWVAVTMEPPI